MHGELDVPGETECTTILIFNFSVVAKFEKYLHKITNIFFHSFFTSILRTSPVDSIEQYPDFDKPLSKQLV